MKQGPYVRQPKRSHFGKDYLPIHYDGNVKVLSGMVTRG